MNTVPPNVLHQSYIIHCDASDFVFAQFDKYNAVRIYTVRARANPRALQSPMWYIGYYFVFLADRYKSRSSSDKRYGHKHTCWKCQSPSLKCFTWIFWEYRQTCCVNSADASCDKHVTCWGPIMQCCLILQCYVNKCNQCIVINVTCHNVTCLLYSTHKVEIVEILFTWCQIIQFGILPWHFSQGAYGISRKSNDDTYSDHFRWTNGTMLNSKRHVTNFR